MISLQIKPWVAFGFPYLLIELFYIGIPVVRTDGRTVTWLPNFLGWVDYHISLAMGLRPRARFAITYASAITYFAETKHEEINNWKRNDYRREKRCHITHFYFIGLSVIRLNSRAGKIHRILYWLARDFPRLSRSKKKISFDHEITLPLSSGSIKTQTFGSKKA